VQLGKESGKDRETRRPSFGSYRSSYSMDITDQQIIEPSPATYALLHSYRLYISQETRSDWPELTWLNRFLSAQVENVAEKTSVSVLTLQGQRLVPHESPLNAESLHAELWHPVAFSSLRVVLIGHGESWDVDRDIVDVVAARCDLGPRFLMRHFDHKYNWAEKRCPLEFKKNIRSMND
jgi:hypothetical protein